jgi:hypothetical protein
VAKPRGTKLIVDKANGYQVAIPSRYVRISNKTQLKKIIGAGVSAAEGSGISAQFANKTIKMMAINPKSNASINLVVTDAGGMTADQLPAAKPLLKKEVEKIGARNIKFTEVTLGGAPALRSTYAVKLKGLPSALAVQYITVKGDHGYTLTFSQHTRLAPKIEKQTIGSWRFL